MSVTQAFRRALPTRAGWVLLWWYGGPVHPFCLALPADCLVGCRVMPTNSTVSGEGNVVPPKRLRDRRVPGETRKVYQYRQIYLTGLVIDKIAKEQSDKSRSLEDNPERRDSSREIRLMEKYDNAPTESRDSLA